MSSDGPTAWMGSSLVRDHSPTARLPGIEAVYRRQYATPPGGGSCHWCSARLYRKRGLWTFAEILEDGHARAVHVPDCMGQDFENRPEEPLVFVDELSPEGS